MFHLRSLYKGYKRWEGRSPVTVEFVPHRRHDQVSQLQWKCFTAGKERRHRTFHTDQQSSVLLSSAVTSAVAVSHWALAAYGFPKSHLKPSSGDVRGMLRASFGFQGVHNLLSWITLVCSAHHLLFLMVMFAFLWVIGSWYGRVFGFFNRVTTDFKVK